MRTIEIDTSNPEKRQADLEYLICEYKKLHDEFKLQLKTPRTITTHFMSFIDQTNKGEPINYKSLTVIQLKKVKSDALGEIKVLISQLEIQLSFSKLGVTSIEFPDLS